MAEGSLDATKRDGAKVAPSTQAVSPARKLLWSAMLLGDHWARSRQPPDFAAVFEDLEAYDRLLGAYGGPGLAGARVLEIGFGARPYRLMALLSAGVDARGVDAEQPLLEGTRAEYRAIYRANGAERMLKSLVRHAAFDRAERRSFEQELARRGQRLRLDRARFVVADAADLDLAPGSIDLIVSEDVFEHIPRSSLERLVPRMARALTPRGLALISPNVFTGITGGHVLEWNRRSLAAAPTKRRRSEPWDHLRMRRSPANTQLNELWRRDYRELFATSFEILEERVALPDLGREHLQGAAARELSHVPEEELLSNQVRFVLRATRSVASVAGPR